jgi:hypothetical protein
VSIFRPAQVARLVDAAARNGNGKELSAAHKLAGAVFDRNRKNGGR